MKLNHFLHIVGAGVLLASSATVFAGDLPSTKDIVGAKAPIDPWADLRRPMTNTTLFDLAVPDNIIHPVFIHTELPNMIDTIIGELPVGGNYQVYALQLELQLSERLSLNASKDGYIVFNPDSTLSKSEGFANIGAGLKYAWLLKPEQGLASNIQLLFETPTGNDRVWQGNGDGVFIPTMNVTKLDGPWQLVNQFGFKLPVNDSETTSFYNSVHVSYALTDWLFPLVELNYFKVLDAGDGGQRFNAQAGGAIPALATFEGGDLVNWGAANSKTNSDLVTLAAGFRMRCPSLQNVDLGFAWEFPLTEEEQSIMSDRFTVDMVIRF